MPQAQGHQQTITFEPRTLNLEPRTAHFRIENGERHQHYNGTPDNRSPFTDRQGVETEVGGQRTEDRQQITNNGQR